MIKNSKNYKCRACSSKKINIFKLKHFTFLPKNNKWKSFYCFHCGSVSDFNIFNNKTNYKSGKYREYDPLLNNLDPKFKKVSLPISSWSLISFMRWMHIWKIIKKKSYLLKNKINMLDYGGYNGFLPYAFKQKHNIKSWVADYDPKGLEIAKFLKNKTIDLSKKKQIKKNFFNLITMVHVLEHLQEPNKILYKIKSYLKKDGLLYIEVPNLYGFPLGDNAHLVTFTKYSLYSLVKKIGFNIIDYGYTSSPKDSIRLDYYYNNIKENLFILAIKNKKKQKIIPPSIIISKNIKDFKKKIQLSYANIMIKEISFTLFTRSIKYFKTFINFLTYGLIEIFSLTFFNNSIINKFKK